VIDWPAGGGRAVVTRRAAAADLRMVDLRYRAPAGRRVAAFAADARDYVRRALAGGACAVMAAGATGGNARMREVCRPPGSRDVAGLAFVAGCDVSRILAAGPGPVMTTEAGTLDLRVIHPSGRLPRRRRMAGLAARAGRDVRRVLARCARAGVAAGTAVDDARVGER